MNIIVKRMGFFQLKQIWKKKATFKVKLALKQKQQINLNEMTMAYCISNSSGLCVWPYILYLLHILYQQHFTSDTFED